MTATTHLKKNNLTDTDVQYHGSAQYLAFSLADENYGVDILSVEEIRGLDRITRLPNAPDFIKGVVNLRGAIVPVVDLRARFELPLAEYGPDTTVIVLRSDAQNGRRIMGVIVDAVSDVFDVIIDHVAETPELGVKVSTDFITGITTRENHMTMLLAVDKLFECGRDNGLLSMARTGE